MTTLSNLYLQKIFCTSFDQAINITMRYASPSAVKRRGKIGENLKATAQDEAIEPATQAAALNIITS